MSRRKHRDDEPTLFDLPLQDPEEVAPGPHRDEADQPDERDDSSDDSRSPAPPPAEAEPAAGRLFPDGPPEPGPTSRTGPGTGSRTDSGAGSGSGPAAPPPAGSAPSARSADTAASAPPAATTPPRSGAHAEGDRPPIAPAGERPVPVSVRFLAGLADLAIHLALAVALLFGARLLGVRAGFEDWLPILLFLVVFSFFYSVLPLAFWGQTPGMAWAGLEARAADGGSLTFPQTALRWLGGVLSVVLLGLPTLLAIGGGRSLADRLSDSACALVE